MLSVGIIKNNNFKNNRVSHHSYHHNHFSTTSMNDIIREGYLFVKRPPGRGKSLWSRFKVGVFSSYSHFNFQIVKFCDNSNEYCMCFPLYSFSLLSKLLSHFKLSKLSDSRVICSMSLPCERDQISVTQ